MSETCPKCAEPKTGDSCPKCGLVFDRFDESRLDAEIPPAIKQLWEHVEQEWDDRARHALFVERALDAGAGGYAAACYRRRGADPIATEQLARITGRLEQLLLATGTSPEEAQTAPSRKLLLLVVFLLMFALGALLVFLFRR